ncbi:MAG: hypothetical protein IIU08_05050 [Clostridia bacterium]|nr:hypothetical protein [Clostridia bacterium]MBQ5355218.1 hypothetical protein [Clostridia bacterium]
MNPKTANLLWSLSLILIGISALVLAAGSIFGIELGDVLVRILGGTALLMLPVLAFTTVVKIKNANKNK